jgi:hypothetical protein
MRWSLGLMLVVAIAAGVTGAAQSAPQAATYWTVTGRADFYYHLDYGSHPDGVFNGGYTAHLRYKVAAIASYANGRLTSRQPLVDGRGDVTDERTMWDISGARKPVVCDENPRSSTNEARRSSGSQISVGGGVAHVDPGNAIRWAVGCAATESLAIHGLPDGKTISANVSSRGMPRLVACSDSYTHDADRSDPNGHKFIGTVGLFLKLAPIPRKRLADVRRSLRKQVGRDITIRGFPRSSSFRDCLR